ncbi:MAG: hypothetical protein COX65_01680 [Elusimicrobia bacterium CG_4_10_14_0_2_um_filter_56_8]|nr:MAG: hypothetical protein COX65_01680 [Elusimicrobia bacterium CG_4_10_14_0_2_um_filter_56_8]
MFNININKRHYSGVKGRQDRLRRKSARRKPGGGRGDRVSKTLPEPDAYVSAEGAWPKATFLPGKGGHGVSRPCFCVPVPPAAAPA